MKISNRARLWLASGSLLAVAAGLTGWLTTASRVEVLRPVRRELVQTVVSSGRVLSPAQITLAALVSGTVASVDSEQGDAVTAGQLLASLDDGELAATVRQAEATLTRARAGAFQVRRLSLPAARERLHQAELALAQAERDLTRSEGLGREGALAGVSLEQARTAVEVARSQRTAAHLQVEASAGAGSETLLAAAAIAQAEAQLAASREAWKHARIHSPVAGVLLERRVEPGDSVQAGARLFVVSATGTTRLVIEPDERNLALLRVGQPALASADAFARQRFAALVSFIAPSVDPQRGTIEVHLNVPEPLPFLIPDMTVSVEIEVERKRNALTLPGSALRDLASEHPSVLVVEHGRAVRREVQLGMMGEELVEVLGGLREDDQVIDPSATVTPGTRVRPRTRER